MRNLSVTRFSWRIVRFTLNKEWRAAGVIFTLLLFCAAAAIPMHAQVSTAGSIVGQVTDPSGAVVPGATVTLTDLATKQKQTTTSNANGRYAFLNVPAGSYNITVKKQGFAETTISNQTLTVGNTATVNIPMKVGGENEQVEVVASNTELQTMNATVGNTINNTALESLPMLGRDVSTFVTLQPGVSPDGSVAGAVVDQSTFELDGGNNTSDMDGSNQVYTPSFGGDPTGGTVSNSIGGAPSGVMPTPADSVQEFKVSTTGQTADFNSSAGADIKLETRRGTDTWHGTAYEYYLDNNFSANSWDNKCGALCGGTYTPVPDWHRNWFGAGAGGPIIPKNILGGKTYLFVNLQGSRWPNSTTILRATPTASMRAGLLTFGGTVYDMKAIDPRGIGIDPLVQQLWTKYMPLPNSDCGGLLGSRCDNVNVAGFRANMAIPQNDNFLVGRLDHDFGQKWHFNSTYRYYKLTRASTAQYDIGGFFPGDTLGVPKATANRPQQPWYLTAGLTTQVTSNLTNDFHWSYLRNYWAWDTKQAPPQFAGLGGALEPFGESATASLVPFNVNAQQARTRFWNGHDHFFRDDLSLLKGNHLFQFGGSYARNWDWHQRTDNGGGIFYEPVYQLGDSSGSGLVTMSDLNFGALPDRSSSKTFRRYAAAVLGIVTDSQIAYTRQGAQLNLNPPLTPAFDKSTIPYYNVYFSDTWHMKPTFTLTYGLGWALEMPPTEQNGKQIELVDASGQLVDINAYLNQRKNAALQGQVYNPILGFDLVGNTAQGLKYPYNPYYGQFSPRVAVAWSPKFSDGILGKLTGNGETVFRAGYGRIYGRLNGVDLVLVPLLGIGLIQPVQCRQGLSTGACGPATPTATTAFRIGVDGLTAPLAAASPTLPQPFYPGVNGVAGAAGEALDPHFRPNSVDSVDVTIQRQLNNKMTVELGYIGRWIRHEYQPVNTNAVPYMMTLGGQQFQAAYAAVEKAMGCATSVSACDANGAPVGMTPQPFFEAALAGTGYCNGFATCTDAIVTKEEGNFATQSVWNLWSDLDNGGVGGGPGGTTLPGWNFARSMLNSPLYSSPFGAVGQLTSGVGVNASIGYGNYNAGFVTFKMSDWKGLTAQSTFTWSKALGTGAFVQATSEYAPNDPFDLGKMYGVQNFDRKFIYNAFMVYQPPFFKNQSGLIGRVLGGWTFSPIFAAGSGAPLYCNTQTDAQSFGGMDGANFFSNEQCVFAQGYTGANASTHYGITGDPTTGAGTGVAGPGTGQAINIFANPGAVWNTVRPPILGIDTRDGGVGPIRGLPYWNVDFAVKKKIMATERFSAELSATFLNVFNHNKFADPTLDISNPSSWGVVNSQGNNPRNMEFGIRVNF